MKRFAPFCAVFAILLHLPLPAAFAAEKVDWVRIDGGRFTMKSLADGESHTVEISSFLIAKTEVTTQQYAECLRAGACQARELGTGYYCNLDRAKRRPEKGRMNHPINCVSWEGANEYARFVGGRLPTEAEWEYAARSGGQGNDYPWGNSLPTEERAVMFVEGKREPTTMPVCSKPKGNTAQGLCDMAGNVAEWVSDWYGGYPRGNVKDPTGPASGTDKVYRGGSYNYGNAAGLRVDHRYHSEPGFRRGGVGFRPVKEIR